MTAPTFSKNKTDYGNDMKPHQIPIQVRLAGFVKSVLPENVHGPIRGAWRAIVRKEKWWSNQRLKISLIMYRLKGGSYLDWYAEKLDMWARRKRDPETMARRYENNAQSGQDDLGVLQSFGLKPHHATLDYGAGHLRSGRWIMEYLEPGKYVGNDTSAERLDIGREWFADVLEQKQGKIVVNPDNSFDWLDGRRFDFIWCHAVLGHMPGPDVDEMIGNARKAMHADSVFLFTHNFPAKPPADPDWMVIEEDARNYAHSEKWLRQTAQKYGYHAENGTHVIEPLESYHTNLRLMKLTLTGAASART